MSGPMWITIDQAARLLGMEGDEAAARTMLHDRGCARCVDQFGNFEYLLTAVWRIADDILSPRAEPVEEGAAA